MPNESHRYVYLDIFDYTSTVLVIKRDADSYLAHYD